LAGLVSERRLQSSHFPVPLLGHSGRRAVGCVFGGEAIWHVDPLVKGSGQTGVTVDADTNGTSGTTLTLEPPLKASPSDNAVLTGDKRTSEMILSDETLASLPSNEAGVYQEKTFTAYAPVV
jgi:hypothetical protein